MDKPSQIIKLLSRPDLVGEGVLQRGHYLTRIDRMLSPLLDENTRLHCQVGNVRDGTLILFCDSTAWASRLRYLTPSLLPQLQRHKGLSALRQIEVKVLPKQVVVSKERVASLSDQARSCLQACADSIDDDGLRAALLHLSAHHKTSD